MMKTMPASEFRRWAILEHIQPFGEYGEWLRTGLLVSLIANVHRKPATWPFSPEDFIPETLRTRKGGGAKMEPKQIFAMMMLLKEHQDAYLARLKKKKKTGKGETDGNDSGA